MIVYETVTSLSIGRKVRGDLITFEVGNYSVTIQKVGESIGHPGTPFHVFNNFNRTYMEHSTLDDAEKRAHKMLGTAFNKALKDGYL